MIWTAILCAIVFGVVVFLSNKEFKGWHLPVLVITGLLAVGLGLYDSIQRVRKDTVEVNKGRSLSEARNIMLAEFVATKAQADGVGSPVFFKDASQPRGYQLEEGLRKVFGDELIVYTGGSDEIEFGDSEEMFTFTPKHLNEARKLGARDMYIFSELPGPLITSILVRRTSKRVKVAFLNVSSQERAEHLIGRGINYVVVPLPPEQQVSQSKGKLVGNLERSFEGEFTLLTP